MSKKYTRAQAVASFMSLIGTTGEDCWLWEGATYNCGYGVFRWRGKNRAASRVSWEIANGKDAPDDKDVLHTCDNRLCVNPNHLVLGTHKDNMHDMRAKGRGTGKNKRQYQQLQPSR